MKRRHRLTHKLLWLLAAPLIAAVLVAAIALRPPAPVTPDLPQALGEEAS